MLYLLTHCSPAGCCMLFDAAWPKTLRIAMSTLESPIMIYLVQYPQTDRRNEENPAPPLTPADVGHSTRETLNRSSGFALGNSHNQYIFRSSTMDETTLNANTSNEITATQQSAMATPTPPPVAESTEVAASEHRQAYGTAKTENLRDTGLWRFLLPAFVILGCVALLAVPLLFLVPLVINSLDAI